MSSTSSGMVYCGEGGVALAVAAQVGRYDAIPARKVVDLVLPRLGAAGVAVHEHYRLFGPLRPDVHHTQLHVGQPADGHVNPVEVEVQLDVPAA